MKNVGLLLLPRFSMMGFSGLVEPMRAANMLSERQRYDWAFLSPDGKAVESNCGARIFCDARLADAAQLDAVMVCSGNDGRDFADRDTLALLRRLYRDGCRIGAVGDGSFVLARAGLLENHGCAIHWRHLPAFRERHPLIDVSRALFRFSGPIVTAAGGAGALDMMLRLIAEDHGEKLSSRIARWFLHERVRSVDDEQPMAETLMAHARDHRLERALAVMADNLEDPIGVGKIAAAAGCSTRQLQRLFEDHTGVSPMRCYSEMRLDRARTLLRETDLAVTEIAVASGYPSPSHFARAYRSRFGRPPRTDRVSGS